MKKQIIKPACLFLIVFLILLSVPASTARSWSYEDMFVENSILYELLSDFDRPDDPILGDNIDTPYDECVAIAENFELDHREELEDFFGQMNYDVDQGIDIFCDTMIQIPGYINDAMNDAGLFFQTSATTNFTDFNETPDWKNIENLTFDHPMGTVYFDQPVNLFSYDFIMLALAFSSSFYLGQEVIYIDSDLVQGMKEMGAHIILKNLPDYEQIKILVDGEADTEGIVSQLIYDKDNRTATFDVEHFSYFMVVDINYSPDESSDDDEDNDGNGHAPRIYSVKRERITYSKGGAELIKLTIKGRHFEENANVYLDGTRAKKVRKLSSRMISAYFPLSDFDLIGKNEFRLKVFNPGGKDESFDDKISISNLPLMIFN